MVFICPICEAKLEVKGPAQGMRLVCHNCYNELAIYRRRAEYFLGCPFCKEEVFSPENCGACERRRCKVNQFSAQPLLEL